MDKELSVWIEILRHTTDKNEYIGDSHGFMLHIFSTLKHTLPDYDWPAGDKKLEKDVKWHLKHFNMPAWNRVMEKLVHGGEDDGLKVAMEQLMAYKVKSPRLHGFPGVLPHYLLKDYKFPSESHHITMHGMVRTLVDIIDEARATMKRPLQRTGDMSYVFELYKQDLKDLKAWVDLKTDDENDFLTSIYRSVGI